jgi:SpoIID/LytB domain protein
MKNIITLSLIFLITIEIYSQNLFDSEPQVRVRIIDSLEQLKVSFSGKWKISSKAYTESFLEENNPILFSIEKNGIVIQTVTQSISTGESQLVLSCSNTSGTLTISDVPYGTGWWWEGKEDRIYEGEIRFIISAAQKFEVIVKLPLETYLSGVVPYEMGNDSPLEALKSQAVAARSEAVIALTSKLYSGPHHDLTSDVECQVFSGNHKRTPITDRAVRETRSLILSERKQPINAYYASNCAGHSELIKNVWPDRPEPESYQQAGTDNKDRINLNLHHENDVRRWIFSKPDVYCNPDRGIDLPPWSQKNFRWKKVIDKNSISKMIAGGNQWGYLLDIKVLRRGQSGRINLALFVFERDSLKVEGELQIRQLWQPALRSSCFVVDSDAENFILHGAGWGHGVGMCQSGAIAQAKLGATFINILKHYYQKADLMSLY